MEIVDDDQQRPLLEATLDQQAGGEHDLALELLGIELARARLLDAKQVAQHRRDRLGDPGLGAKRAQARASFSRATSSVSSGWTP